MGKHATSAKVRKERRVCSSAMPRGSPSSSSPGAPLTLLLFLSSPSASNRFATFYAPTFVESKLRLIPPSALSLPSYLVSTSIGDGHSLKHTNSANGRGKGRVEEVGKGKRDSCWEGEESHWHGRGGDSLLLYLLLTWRVWPHREIPLA